jgi:hypothetical protein
LKKGRVIRQFHGHAAIRAIIRSPRGLVQQREPLPPEL